MKCSSSYTTREERRLPIGRVNAQAVILKLGAKRAIIARPSDAGRRAARFRRSSFEVKLKYIFFQGGERAGAVEQRRRVDGGTPEA